MRISEYIDALAELAVGFGANVQPGQIVAVHIEPGKEELARAIAASAYRHGAKFVDVWSFDPHIKRARIENADPQTLAFVPHWYGDRARALSDARAALVSISGPAQPHLMRGLDAALVGRDLLPRVKELLEVVEERTLNWTAVPCPTPGWAQLVHSELDPDAALERLWDQVADVCRLTEPDPVAAWNARLDHLTEIADRITALELDSVHFHGPGTDLRIGLLAASTWRGARFSTIDGLIHAPNLPTEEVFTSPDPRRVDGTVRSTKPLFVSGRLLTGLRVRFENGRAVEIDADDGAEALRAIAAVDESAARLGEVALVDRESRIGRLDTVFFDTLLDENAASHIALGQAYLFTAADPSELNDSSIHVDFMIGSDDVAVTGIRRDGTEVPLLTGGVWQI